MSARIKVGDVLKTDRGFDGVVVYMTNLEAVIKCGEMLHVFNLMDGKFDALPHYVILPPAPPEFDWSTVPEWTGINALAKDGVTAEWWGYSQNPIIHHKESLWVGTNMWKIRLVQSKLPASLREWRGDWKDSLIVRPGKES